MEDVDIESLGSIVLSCTQATEGTLTRFCDVHDMETDLARSWHEVAADELSRFRLWSSALGANHTRGRQSADYRLRAIPDARDRIVQLLRDLKEYLDDIHDILSGQRQGGVEEYDDDRISPWDGIDISETRSEISELWLMVDDAMNSLMKMSILVRKSTNRNKFDHAVRAAARTLRSSMPTDWDIDHVRHKFPKLEQKPWLVRRLGQTSTYRRTFLLYARDHQLRLASHDVAFRGSGTVESESTLSTVASTVVAPAAASDLQRLESFEGDDASVATSTTSYNDAGYRDGKELEVIPLWSVCPEGEPGVCPYCRGVVLFSRQKAWR